MASLGTLTLDLVAKIGGFTGPLNKAERASKKNAAAISKHQRAVTAAIGSSLKSLAGWAAGFVAFGAIKSFVTNSFAAADAIGKVAKTAGITTDTLQEMRHAASLNGVEFGQLDQGMQKFNKSIGELKAGTGTLYTYLSKTDRALMSQVQSARSTDEALNLVYKSLKNITDSSERSALAVAAFGRSGQRLAIMADTYEELREEARSLGLVIDSDLIAGAEEANDKMDTMSRIIKTQLIGAVLELAPTLQLAANGITELATRWNSFFNKNSSAAKSAERDAEYLNLLTKSIASLSYGLDAAEKSGENSFATISEEGVVLTHTIESARKDLKMLNDDLSKFNGMKIEAGTSGGGTDTALSQQQSIELYKKAFSSLETITQKTYEVMKMEYQSDRDEFISLTGDKLTAQAIYSKNIEALNKKLTGNKEDTSWSDFGDVVQKTSEKNYEKNYEKRLELIKSSNAAIAAENNRQLQDDIARDVAYRQLVEEADLAELNNKFDGVEKEVSLHEYKYEKLKELYAAGSKELTEIERIEAAERMKITEDEFEMQSSMQRQNVGNVAAAFDMMSGLASQYAGEQKAIYKALFAISKAFALADAIVHWHGVVAKATDSAPPPYNIPAIIAANIQGAIPVAGIVATTVAGMAHDGINSIPEDGSWYLKKGERVTTANTSKKLDDTLNRLQNNYNNSTVNNSVYNRRGNMPSRDIHLHNNYNGPVFLNRAQMRDVSKMMMAEMNRERTRLGAVV